MKYITYENGGSVTGFVTIGGMNVTGYVKLRVDPVDRVEAATKRYVDSLSLNPDPDGIVGGTFLTTVMPGFSGQLISEQGNAVLYLSDNGIAPNTYTKIIVGTDGLVTSGSTLTQIDIPPLSWSKIKSGLPTTLEGYGITDAVSVNNPQVTGLVRTDMVTFENDEIVTKYYVDSKNVVNKEYEVGDIITLHSETTPTGFLRCNGGELSIVSYPDLYSVIGNTFGGGGGGQTGGGNGVLHGAGRPWEQQYIFNNSEPDTLGAFTETTNFPATISDCEVVVTKNRVYALGGASDQEVNNGGSANIYSAPINPDGTIGTWSLWGYLPIPNRYFKALIIKNNLYIIGGYSDIQDAHLSDVHYASINSDGTLGTWSQGPSMVRGVSAMYAVVTTNRLHVFGGGGNPYGDSELGMQSVEINEDGTLLEWTHSPASGLESNLDVLAVLNDKIFLFTVRYMVDDPTPRGVIKMATIEPDGTLGDWSYYDSTMEIHTHAYHIVTSNRIYCFGGWDETYTSIPYCRSYEIVDGNLTGERFPLGNLPVSISAGKAFATNSRIYLVGGRGTNYSLTNKVLTCTFNGGRNDYLSMPYETGGVLDPVGTFNLPDYSSLIDPSAIVYVKY